MKVAIVALNAGRGSGEIARQHAEALIAHGHEVVYLHAHMGTGVAGADNRDVPLHSPILPVHEYLPDAGELQRPVSQMTAEEAGRYLDDYTAALDRAAVGADIVFGHHGNISAVAAAAVARRHRIPYVLFLHGTAVEPRLFGGYADETWTRIAAAVTGADGILVTTEYVRDELVRLLFPDLPRDRFFVLPCGVDLEAFRPGRVDDIHERYDLPGTFVICPGAITVLKGTHNVVEATRLYAHLAPTIFIGDGDLRPVLEERLGDRGRFLGFVPSEDKALLINAATILAAAPEKREHFGIIYIEALAAGTVPVAYSGGGVDSIVTPGVGYLTDRDPRALGGTIRDLLHEPERLTSLVAPARKTAVERYASDALGRRLVSWLESIAAFSHRPTGRR